MALGAGVVFLMGQGVCLFAPQLLSLFTSDPLVMEAAVVRMNIINRTYFLLAAMDAVTGTLRGLGWSVAPMFISLAGTCGLRLVWVATVFRAVGTPQSLYWVYPVSWIVTGLVFLVCYFAVRGRLFAKAEERAAQAGRG